ncbi:hypothetical protein ABIC63_002912 [Pseudacidovorax sp. 1753]|uniref:hypothetical protein n=1 Tax=Pseudacidovorax sp. 1753 TaxID=3156419 RepID=UPI0033958F00
MTTKPLREARCPNGGRSERASRSVLAGRSAALHDSPATSVHDQMGADDEMTNLWSIRRRSGNTLTM